LVPFFLCDPVCFLFSWSLTTKGFPCDCHTVPRKLFPRPSAFPAFPLFPGPLNLLSPREGHFFLCREVPPPPLGNWLSTRSRFFSLKNSQPPPIFDGTACAPHFFSTRAGNPTTPFPISSQFAFLSVLRPWLVRGKGGSCVFFFRVATPFPDPPPPPPSGPQRVEAASGFFF